MTGIVLLSDGIVEADLHRLNARFGYDLGALVAMKVREQAEFEGDACPYEAQIGELFERLDRAREESSLPEDVPNRAALNSFLVRLRLAGR